MVNGTVTISIKDFKELESSNEKAESLAASTKRAVRELQVFLSFMCTRKDMEPLVEEFNRQSSGSEIVIEEGHAKIKFNDQ